MEWFINHDCCLNHTGNPQVYLCFYLRANHKFLGGRIEEVRLLASFGLKESTKRWHFVTSRMNVTVFIRNSFKSDNFQMFYTKAPLACNNNNSSNHYFPSSKTYLFW